MPDTPFAIEIAALRKVYPGRAAQEPKEALKGIDLQIPAGSIYGILGPNGAGKSTLINILAGLVTKTSGSVQIWGFDQDINPRMSRASIGVVPQELNIDPFLSPLQTLETQAGMYGVPAEKRRSMELLEALGLADKAHSYTRGLSGGMRRRLLVAKALVHAPPVLVLDEPTAGVDLELRRQLWDYVRTLNTGGVTVILTTHYLEEAQEMCDRIAIIHQGQVAAEAATADLLATIDRKALILDIVGTVPSLQSVSAVLPDGVSASHRGPQTIVLSYAQQRHRVPELLAALSELPIQIADVTTEQADLEDVFLALTSRDSGPQPNSSTNGEAGHA